MSAARDHLELFAVAVSTPSVRPPAKHPLMPHFLLLAEALCSHPREEDKR